MREAIMEYAACNVVYVDRTAHEDRLVKRHETPTTYPAINVQNHEDGNATVPSPVDGNLTTLLGTFSEGTAAIPLSSPIELDN